MITTNQLSSVSSATVQEIMDYYFKEGVFSSSAMPWKWLILPGDAFQLSCDTTGPSLARSIAGCRLAWDLVDRGHELLEEIVTNAILSTLPDPEILLRNEPGGNPLPPALRDHISEQLKQVSW